MANETNKNNPLRASSEVLTNVAAVAMQPTAPDRSVMLNGGNPIQIGFNTNINFHPINKDTYKAVVEKADKRIFPTGLKGLPAGFFDFILKAEAPFFEWMKAKENLAFFTANPLSAMLKFCKEKNMAMPKDVQDFLTKTHRTYAGLKYSAPGVRFNKVTSTLNQTRK